MPKTRPCVISIAGFDPSAGAGILADIKTFEQHKVMGMGVATGITFQNDSEFEGVKWITPDEIIRQIKVLTRKYTFNFIKVGMIQDIDTLSAIISELKTQHSQKESFRTKLIWDPILKASTGYQIHKEFDRNKLNTILKNIYLLTPNSDEIKQLTGEEDETKAAKELSNYCNVLLKGGHSQKDKGRDRLFTTEGKAYPFKAKKISETGKHGSGCVLSSAITANLANGLSLQRSCLKGKDYVTNYLMSTKTMLGYHKT